MNRPDYMLEICDGVGSRCLNAVSALAIAEAMREKHADLRVVGGSERIDSGEDQQPGSGSLFK